MSVGAGLSGLLIGLIGGVMSGALGVSSGGALVPLVVLLLNVEGASRKESRWSRRFFRPVWLGCVIT